MGTTPPVLMKWTQPSSHTSLTRGKMVLLRTLIVRKKGEAFMDIDLAKNVFQLHGADARGRAVLSRRA